MKNLASTFQNESIHGKWESVYRGNVRQDRFNDHMLNALLRLCDVPSGATALDAGCGIGDHTFRLARHGFRCTGVDVSQPMLEQARRTANEEYGSHQIDFVKASLEDLQLNRPFGLIHCRGVLMHIPDWRSALAKLCEHLAPNGTIMIWENHDRSLEMMIVHMLATFRKPSRRRVITDDGIEFHDDKDGFAPLTRVAKIGTIQQELQNHGIRVVARHASEFFDINRFPAGVLRNAAIRLNRFAFGIPGARGLACGNVIIGKRARTPESSRNEHDSSA